VLAGKFSNNFGNNGIDSVEWGSVLYIAAFIKWEKAKQGIKQGLCACGYSIYKNKDSKEKILIYRDYFFGNLVESAYEAEMKALLTGIACVPLEERLTVRTTQQGIANGINRDLEFWAENNWHTKQGSTIKCQQEWYELLQLMQGRKIGALCTQEEEFVLLQAGCKDLLRVFV
jgi:ribonuclease HI